MTDSKEFVGYGAVKSNGEMLPGIIRRPLANDLGTLRLQLDSLFKSSAPHTIVEIHKPVSQ